MPLCEASTSLLPPSLPSTTSGGALSVTCWQCGVMLVAFTEVQMDQLCVKVFLGGGGWQAHLSFATECNHNPSSLAGFTKVQVIRFVGSLHSQEFAWDVLDYILDCRLFRHLSRKLTSSSKSKVYILAVLIYQDIIMNLKFFPQKIWSSWLYQSFTWILYEWVGLWLGNTFCLNLAVSVQSMFDTSVEYSNFWLWLPS